MVLNSVMVVLHRGHEASNGRCRPQSRPGSVPPSFRELNLKAFEKGFEYGNTALAAAPPRQGLEELAYSGE